MYAGGFLLNGLLKGSIQGFTTEAKRQGINCRNVVDRKSTKEMNEYN
jgi:hypothetical protein